MNWLREQLRKLFLCAHAQRGPAWLRGSVTYQSCLGCGQPVKSTLADPLDPATGKPLIGQPVLIAPVDRTAEKAQVRRDYEEQLALRGPLGSHRSGIERTMGAGATDVAAAELERLLKL